MSPTQVLQRIVDEHSERRVGNGELPTPDYRCSDCGEPADLGLWVQGYSVEGDQEYPAFAATPCCNNAHYIDRDGKEYTGHPGEVEEY